MRDLRALLEISADGEDEGEEEEEEEGDKSKLLINNERR